jgi:hypothetical protein
MRQCRKCQEFKPSGSFVMGEKVHKFCTPCREEIAEQRRLDREVERSQRRTESRDRDGTGRRFARLDDLRDEQSEY